MSELVQCAGCRGRKQLTGLGTMLVDCHHCKGVGYIEFINKTSIPIVDVVCGSTLIPESKIEMLTDNVQSLNNDDVKARIANKLSRKGKKG